MSDKPLSAALEGWHTMESRPHLIGTQCKACGTCVAACPSGAIKARHFTDEQIFAQIEGVLAWPSNQP